MITITSNTLKKTLISFLDEFIKKIKKINLIIIDDELMFLLVDMPVNVESKKEFNNQIRD